MRRILSVQSHVAYGYVGNRAAVFPLQRLGFDVWAVNTVQFSNHTGYGAWRGEIFSASAVAEVIDGIGDRGVLGDCSAVLSGYMGEAALGQVIVDTAARIKADNPDALYCCDPVIGDVGRGIFVRAGIPEFMRQTAVPAADIVTPNQFELSYLTGRDIDTLDHALAACAEVRSLGPKVVLLTSLTRKEAAEDMIEMLVDTADGAWLIGTPRLPLDPAPNGSGDCVAALFLGHYLNTRDPAVALERATAAIYAVFAATGVARSRELALIQAQDALINPAETFSAVQVRGAPTA